MTTHFQIITAWIDSCDNELQLKTISEFVRNELKTDDKQRDDIINYLNQKYKQRAWVAAKIAQRDYTDVSNTRLLVCDEQPSDNCTH